MTAEFNWWLLLVGVVGGAALTWFVMGDARRREDEVTERELPAEAAWIAGALERTGTHVAPDTAEAVLRAHRTYLSYPPPDALVDPAELGGGRSAEAAPEPSPAAAAPAPAPAPAPRPRRVTVAAEPPAEAPDAPAPAPSLRARSASRASRNAPGPDAEA